MANESTKLIQMKQKLEATRQTRQQYKGQLEVLNNQLSEAGFENINHAEERLTDLDNELEAKEAAFKKGMAKLEADYDWDVS